MVGGKISLIFQNWSPQINFIKVETVGPQEPERNQNRARAYPKR